MNQPTAIDATPYFFLVTDKYALGTPRGMSASERTIDIPFHDLAKNYDLQEKLNLVSAVLIRPDFLPPVAYPKEGSELIEGAAMYLSAFCDDPQERKQRNEYLVKNGVVRILITDEALLKEIKKVHM